MFPDTGKTLRTDTYRTVNLPEPVEVEEAPDGLPLVVKASRRQAVAVVEDRWRIDEEWWRHHEPVSRVYYEVLLSSGQRLQLYKDLIRDCWYRQSY
jgi:hypothetical protein